MAIPYRGGAWLGTELNMGELNKHLTEIWPALSASTGNGSAP